MTQESISQRLMTLFKSYDVDNSGDLGIVCIYDYIIYIYYMLRYIYI